MPRAPRGAPTLKRLTGEAVAIFVGVAAALAGQAWFEARSERVLEREFLESIVEEVVRLDEQVKDVATTFEELRTTAVELAFLIARPMDASRPDSVARLAPSLSRYTAGRWLGPAEALLAPEALRLVQDATLRSELAAFRSDITGFRVVLDQNSEFILSEWRAFGVEHFNFRGAGGFWQNEPETPPVSRHVRDGSQIAESPEFENLLDLLIVQYRNILSTTDELPDRIAEVRELINGRLAAL